MTREIKETTAAIEAISTAREKWAQYDTPTAAKRQLRTELMVLLSEFELGCPQLLVDRIDIDRMEEYSGYSRLVDVGVTVEVR